MEFTNSPLATYVRISPNTNPRKNNIDTITVHCMAGDLSVETCGELFSRESRGASSNYGIGSDGRIGLYAEEKRRSWCTSSAANDHRAVTIEVANCSGAPDWKVSDAAYISLVKLCADICIRNDIPTLLWCGDKNLIGNVEKQNLTVHRWFAAKACPGDYLYKLHSKLAADVNALLNQLRAGDKVDEVTDENTNKLELPETNEKIAWNFFKSKGLGDYATAAILGNLFAESGIQPNNLQNTYEKKLGFTDSEYTAAVNSGSYKNFVRDSAGYGIAQWTYWSRKQGLLDYARSTKRSIADLNMQLEFLWTEFTTSFKGVLAEVKSAKSIREASDVILTKFEMPANQSDAVKEKRAGHSTHYYNLYAICKDLDTNTVISVKFPYTVRVKCDVLNIRKGPGTNYAKTSEQIKDRGIYTIMEESAGEGASKWGLLKSGAEKRCKWISLDFVEKT